MITQEFIDFLRIGDTVEVTYETGTKVTGVLQENSYGKLSLPTNNSGQSYLSISPNVNKIDSVKIIGRKTWRCGDFATRPSWSNEYLVTGVSSGTVYLTTDSATNIAYIANTLIPAFVDPIKVGSIVETGGLTGKVIKISDGYALLEYGNETRSWTDLKYLKKA
jgi:hypothetical protein